MKTNYWNRRATLTALLCGMGLTVSAQTVQLLSSLEANQPSPSGGSGDSGAPVISADGRYVLFASTANNLLLMSNNAALPTRFPATLNVFLRDRTNGTTALVSVNLHGTGGGNGDSSPVGISTNGRFAVFESSADDLVAQDTNNATDVFVRDLVSGATALVSAGTNGGAGNGESYNAAMTPDAHFVTFASAASDLLPDDTNTVSDVFVRDLWGGVTTLASVGAKAAGLASGSDSPSITPDGHYVAFYSSATNLVPGPVNAGDVYVRDLVSGTTVWASTGALGVAQSVLNATNLLCYSHALSADGKFLAYEASPGVGASSLYQGLIFRFQLATGTTELLHTNAWVSTLPYEDIRSVQMTPNGKRVAFIANTNSTVGTNTCVMLWDSETSGTTLVSGDLNNGVPAGSTCDWLAMDVAGRRVAFSSTATNLTTNTLVGEYHFYCRDTQTGVTIMLDADAGGTGSGISFGSMPHLSADGRFAAFECGDANLVSNDRNRDADVFVRNLETGARELISARHPALASRSPNGSSIGFALSADARFLAFASDADNLAAADTNRGSDIFRRDLVGGTNLLISVGTNGLPGDGHSTEPAISGDGRYVAFTSSSDNLVGGDSNGALDVFVRDLVTGVTSLVSLNASGTGPANKSSYSPTLSSDGRYCLFRSKASNLTAGSFSGSENLFLRDRQANTNRALTTAGLSCAAMTPDGRFVAFAGMSGSVRGNLFVRDSLSSAIVYTSASSGVSQAAISPDGNRLVYCTGAFKPQVVAVDRAANQTWALGTSASLSRQGLHFSPDNRFVTYTAAVTGTNEVYLFDFPNNATVLVSRTYTTGGPANGHSDAPAISADGRFVAYRSEATDLLAADTNGLPDIFLFDRQSGATMLVSAGANNRSCAPLFSAAGRTLVFPSWASEFAAADFNHSGDLFGFAIFCVAILPGNTPAEGPWLSWPAISGSGYRVEFKNTLADPGWQELNGSFTNSGSTIRFHDPSPAADQRVYRVLAF